jgi:predicted dehydrogenase
MRDKLKFGIVGAGMVAQAYVQAFERCVCAELVGLADKRIEAARAMAERVKCRSYETLENMVDDCKPDAVVVCTPPAYHPEMCIKLLNRQIHVLCEKPFSIDIQDAYRMISAARKNGMKLTMASKFRFVKDVVQAKSMVASGILGELMLFENVFASRVEMGSRWNSIPSISGGGVLIDNGTHSVDLMCYFLGPLSDVHVLEGKRSQNLQVEETVTMFVRSLDGVIGSIDLSWSIDKQRESYLDIYGSRGAISIGWKESKYLDYSRKDWAVFGQGYDKSQAFHSQIENFSKAIRGEERLLLNDEEALGSVRVIEAAYRALRQSQWVSVMPLQETSSQDVAAWSV